LVLLGIGYGSVSILSFILVYAQWRDDTSKFSGYVLWSPVTKCIASSFRNPLSALDPASPVAGDMAPAVTKLKNAEQSACFYTL